MTEVLFIVAALTASTPIIAAVLVSIASKREDREWTLGEPDVGAARTIARRIVDFRTDDYEWPEPRSRSGARAPSRSRAPSRARVRAPEPEWEPADAESSQLLLASR